MKRNEARDALLRRIEGEYLEMPGLQLTCDQARRLWGLDLPMCTTLLEIMVDQRFLYVEPMVGIGGRATARRDGGPRHP